MTFVLRFLTQLLERHVEASFQARHSQEHEYAIIWVVVQETLDRVAHDVHDYGRSGKHGGGPGRTWESPFDLR